MDLSKFYDMMRPCHRTLERKMDDDAVEVDGLLWNALTGVFISPVYVSAYEPPRRRTFSRYSRRARFFTHVLNSIQSMPAHSRIMKLFDVVLTNWKKTRTSITRLYFLNVRCLLFLICDALAVPPPYPRSACLRDPKRFDAQASIFNNLCTM